MKSKTLREDRTAAERKSAAVAPRRRRRILQAGFFFTFHKHILSGKTDVRRRDMKEKKTSGDVGRSYSVGGAAGKAGKL